MNKQVCKIIFEGVSARKKSLLVSFSCRHSLDTMVRPLSKELQKISIEELHEDSERLEEDIKHIQEWIKQQPHLNAPVTDKQWILGFLRGCKFSLQITKEKYDMYYTAKNLLPELLKPRDISSIEIQTILKAGIILPLPYIKNHKGPRVILFRFHNCDTSIINVENMSACFYMIMNMLLVEDDNLIISGISFWVDMVNYPLSFIFQLTPRYFKNFFHCILKAYPIRIKGIHATGSPGLAEKLFGLMKGYMGPKLKDRIYVYSENKFENLFTSVPKEYMPKEYGGENSNVEEIRDYWLKKVESYSTWFEESKQYGTNEALRPGKPASFDDVVGIDGSFRKLNID